ncbi:hypothetical protein C1645_880034 [Glomus cerebriforme]|uniref:Uncharacterized protein n=1 Tax=Glomus cerebriforme TaxID=658196 RepID=A0A397SJT1_9GLOM|nr:hypothetical protein C1645_880034 [Glomus cerebriforme]
MLLRAENSAIPRSSGVSPTLSLSGRFPCEEEEQKIANFETTIHFRIDGDGIFALGVDLAMMTVGALKDRLLTLGHITSRDVRLCRIDQGREVEMTMRTAALVKDYFANDLSTHDSKIANEINVHVSEINNTFTAEIGKFNASFTKELTVIIENFNEAKIPFTSEEKLSLNTITNKLSEAEKLWNHIIIIFVKISFEFTSIKASIEILQNDIVQHYAVV